MIKLVITSDSKPTITRCFEYSPIIIGGPQSTSADLKLEDPSLQDRHLQISSQKSDGKTVFFAHNLANDPFSTLNGLPFGKQPLGHNDIIQINDISLRFEIDNPTDIRENPSESPPEKKPEAKAPAREDETLETLSIKKQPTPTFPPHRPFTPLKVSDSSLNTTFPYTKSSFKPSSILSAKPAHTLTSAAPAPNKLSLKDYYLSEYDEDHEHPNDPLKESTSKSYFSAQISKRWRFFVIIASCVLGVLAISACLTYFWVSDQSSEEEIEAARAIADIAMGLTYAQLKNIQPQNQNWSHHEFLKNNLYAIMAPGYTPLAEFDSHGQFSNCPYMLRIHTNSDASHFIVIAQPAPSVLHWLIPKASIAIDSRTMEMRKINDIKSLNRQIVNANSHSEGLEISSEIKLGTLLPLAKLADSEGTHGFVVPKALELIRPGAENLIYNAPRYYLLGQSLLETSLNIVDRHAGAGEVHMLQHELAALMKFPDLVLYSSEGIQQALQAQKALTTIDPNDKFLIAYLQLTAKGKITSAHLLIDDSTSDLAAADDFKQPYPSAFDEPKDHESNDHPVENNGTDKTAQDEQEKNNVDANDPLFLHLTAMVSARHAALKPISDEIADLLKKESCSAQLDCPTRLAKLQTKYFNVHRDEQVKLEKKFEAIANEYAHLPATTLMDFIRAVDLEVAFQEYLKKLSQQPATQQISDQRIVEQIKRIGNSLTWPELENAVIQTNQLLRFENIPKEERLVAFQNSARLIVTQKLNQFILSSDGSSNNFSPDYLQALSNILKNAWIVDPETYDFYIEEFELREPQP